MATSRRVSLLCKRILTGMLAGAFSLLNAAEIKIDFASVKGRMKPEHGVGQPPKTGTSGKMYHYLKEAGIPYSRLHDVGGWHGQNMFVDIPNIFRDFDADENDPASYDFSFTDVLLKDLVANGVEPYYRLGVTIENFFAIKRMRTFPPEDFGKWARICEHVIRHYTEGWANGFRYKITYWEIWNEPDGKGMWSGTFEEFCRLYEVASKHLKSCFPNLKIGGYASCGLFSLVQKAPPPRTLYSKKCVDDFFRYVKDHACPLDFFSIHAYDKEDALLVPDAMKVYAKYCRDELDKLGYGHTELSMNEWLPNWSTPGSARQAALCAAILIGLQDSAFDNAMIYDARVGIGKYSPLFDPSTMKPRLAYWAFCNFNELYRLGKQVAVTGMPENVYAIAATDGSGIGKLFVANIGNDSAQFEASASGWSVFSFQLTDEFHVNTVVNVLGSTLSLPADSFGVLTFLPAKQ